jgi:hypothetical protein
VRSPIARGETTDRGRVLGQGPPAAQVTGFRNAGHAPLPSAARQSPGAAAAPTPPPPRPAVGGDLPRPAVAGQLSKPSAVRVAAGLWFAACAAGLCGVLAALADGDALRDRLSATARETDAAATAAAVEDAVRMTILVVLGAVAVLSVLAIVWTAHLLRRRSWAHRALMVTGVVMLFATDVAQSVVTGGSDLDRIWLLAQLGLAALATVLLFARSTRAWLRRDVTL